MLAAADWQRCLQIPALSDASKQWLGHSELAC